MALAEVVCFVDLEGRGQQGQDSCAEGMAGCLEARYQGYGGGEGRGQGLESGLGWGDVEGFLGVALLERELLGCWSKVAMMGAEDKTWFFVLPSVLADLAIRLAWLPSPGLCLRLCQSELHSRPFAL